MTSLAALAAALLEEDYMADACGGPGTRGPTIWIVGLLAMASLALAGTVQAATVSTDKSDYAPGETVVITGSGWQPGETVSLLLEETSIAPMNHELTAVANGNGDIVNTDFVVEPDDIGVMFTLTASGMSSAQVAQTTFTDSPVVFDAASSAATTGAGAATLTFAHTVSGANRLLVARSSSPSARASRSRASRRDRAAAVAPTAVSSPATSPRRSRGPWII